MHPVVSQRARPTLMRRGEIERVEVAGAYARLDQRFAFRRDASEEVIRSLTVVEVSEIRNRASRSRRDVDLQHWLAIR